jgi:hypothetical protein
MPSDSPAGDAFTRYGRYLAQSIIQRKPTNSKHDLGLRTGTENHEGALPVGILGGGMAGLYTALMLSKAQMPPQNTGGNRPYRRALLHIPL